MFPFAAKNKKIKCACECATARGSRRRQNLTRYPEGAQKSLQPHCPRAAPRSAPEGALSLPGVTQDASAPFRRLPCLLLAAACQPCTVQHTPMTHPRYPEGC